MAEICQFGCPTYTCLKLDFPGRLARGCIGSVDSLIYPRVDSGFCACNLLGLGGAPMATEAYNFQERKLHLPMA